MFIYRVIQSLEERKVQYAIAGGFAVALHGAVRGTIDIGLVLGISKRNFIEADAALSELGLQSRIPVNAEELFNFRKEFITNKNLTAWNFINPQNPAESVDIIITHDLKKMKVKRIRSGDHILKVISIEDLIRMKEESARPQDLEDIKALRRIQK